MGTLWNGTEIRYGPSMCGRFLLKSPVDELCRLLDIDQRPNLRPRYNIAPSQDVVILRHAAKEETADEACDRELTSARWGLIPRWADDPNVGYKMINARAETVDRLTSYREAYHRRRCLIPADGFFEWQVDPNKDKKAPKQPYLIRRADRKPFAFAGLYEHWRSTGDGTLIQTCTIVTTAANRKLAPIHHRMPVILAKKDHGTWLDPKADGRDLLRSCPDDWLETVMVGDRVNKPAHDDPSVLDPIDHPITSAQGSLF